MRSVYRLSYCIKYIYRSNLPYTFTSRVLRIKFHYSWRKYGGYTIVHVEIYLYKQKFSVPRIPTGISFSSRSICSYTDWPLLKSATMIFVFTSYSASAHKDEREKNYQTHDARAVWKLEILDDFSIHNVLLSTTKYIAEKAGIERDGQSSVVFSKVKETQSVSLVEACRRRGGEDNTRAMKLPDCTYYCMFRIRRLRQVCWSHTKSAIWITRNRILEYIIESSYWCTRFIRADQERILWFFWSSRSKKKP
jgi:hypothetical protein